MLLIKTKIGKSNISGLGLFANQFIEKGAVVWKFEPDLDLKISKNKLNNLPEDAKLYIRKHAYQNGEGYYVLGFDNDRFFNHSQDPNCIEHSSEGNEESYLIAIRDIQIGEELTCNYQNFDMDYEFKLNVIRDEMFNDD